MRKILLVVAALLLLGAACGDDSNDSSGSASGSGSGTEESTTAPPDNAPAPVTLEGDVTNHGTEDLSGTELDLELDDFYFSPTFIKVAEGGTVTLHLTNEGEASHTFTIDSLGIDEEVAAGDSADVDVEVPDSGATAWYCRFHKGQGMQGAFFFNEGDTVNT